MSPSRPYPCLPVMQWWNYQLFLSYIFAFTLQVIDGCGRTPARHQPTPTTPQPSKNTPAPTPPTTYGTNQYQLTCNAEEVKDAGCFNGGECFVIEIDGMRGAHCRCPDMWTGKRCEELDGTFFLLPADQFKAAGIATGVFALVIILTVIIIVIIIYRRRKKMRQRARNQNNGYVCKSLIQEGGYVEYSPYNYTVAEKSETNV